MMGSLQKYFSYKMCLLCGIPSVTLLGDREDWAQLVTKLDKIPTLGKEPAISARLLRPVLERFVATFDRPEDPEIVDFWSKCAHRTGGSGPHYLCGWIAAFCFWSEMGDSLYHGDLDGSEVVGLDKVLSHRVETDDIPSGYASVPVTVDDNGSLHDTRMAAGMVGIQATSSGQALDETDDFFYGPDGKLVPAAPVDEPGLDSIQPVSGWWMYETESPEEKGAR